MKKRLLNLLIMVIFSLISSSTEVAAATRNVPTTQYPTIQAAIDAANPGDIVKVAPGTYYENIILKSGVTVQGAGAENTIIDGSYIGSVVTAENVSDAKIDGFTITGGWSLSEGGGGIYCYQSSLVVSNNTITGNIAEFVGYGGGIYCYQSSTMITHNTITDNVGYEEGGGIYCENSDATITYNTITGNGTPDSGGGIRLWSSSGIIASNSITENTSTGGGGIDSYNSPSLTISHNNITGNGGEGAGGIMCSGTTTITNNIIRENVCFGEGGAGGGISCWDTTIITNNIITGNSALYGGGIFIWEGTTTITNNTITENLAIYDGSGVACWGGTTTISNSIIWGNGSYFSDDYYDLFGCTASYSDVGKSFPVLGEGLNNINTDPMFVDSANGNYHLVPSSLLIDAGSNEAPSLPEHDFEGNPRIFNLVVDIGADEVAPQIEIYVLNGSQNPPINTKSNGVIPVAILGSATFNILDVDVTSIPPTFGPDTSTPRHDLSHLGIYTGHQKDVNEDGYQDLMLHFKMKDTGIQPEDTKACLTFSVGTSESYKVCHGIRAR